MNDGNPFVFYEAVGGKTGARSNRLPWCSFSGRLLPAFERSQLSAARATSEPGAGSLRGGRTQASTRNRAAGKKVRYAGSSSRGRRPRLHGHTAQPSLPSPPIHRLGPPGRASSPAPQGNSATGGDGPCALRWSAAGHACSRNRSVTKMERTRIKSIGCKSHLPTPCHNPIVHPSSVRWTSWSEARVATRIRPRNTRRSRRSTSASLPRIQHAIGSVAMAAANTSPAGLISLRVALRTSGVIFRAFLPC